MKRNRFIRRGVALAALCALLSGCSPVAFEVQKGPAEVALPEPEAGVPEAPMGDSKREDSALISLYYISEDGQALKQIQRQVSLPSDKTLEEVVAENLLSMPENAALGAVAPYGTTLLSLEQSNGVVTVDLSIDARSVENEQALLNMRAAFANTLCALDGVAHVNLLIGGQEEGILGMPMGSMGKNDGNLATLWAQVQADEARFVQGLEGEHTLERNVTFYFPAQDDVYILPEVRSIVFSDENYPQTLMTELLKGPGAEQGVRNLTLQNSEVLTSAPEIQLSEDGLKQICFRFAPNLREMLNQAGVSEGQFFAALVYTMSGFVPELEGVTAFIGDQAVSEVQLGGQMLSLEDGVMRREDFHNAAGRQVELYFAAEEGGLTRITRAMDQQSAASPRVLLMELFAGVRPGENAQNVAPTGLLDTDILGVHIEGDQALVNLSANFYRCCQTLDAKAERNLVYAMVNTLTELDGVKTVQFYIEGEVVDVLSQQIYIKAPLMRNPGIIQ
jgi:germination protein M